jgi:Holliday junction DNA helicase RuvA
MRDRLNDWQVTEPAATGGANAQHMAPVDAVSEAVSALVALGYKPQEASRMVRAVDTTDMNSEQIIRQALQNLVKSAG